MTAEPTTADQLPPRESWGDARSRTVEWYDPRTTAAGAAGLSGLDAMCAIRDGVLPPPPIAMLLRMSVQDIEQGRVVFGCAVDESVYNPIGVVHGGLVCTLLDTVVGCAVHTTLPQGVGYTSIELKVSYLRPVHATSGPLRAVGRVVKPGSRVAFAEGEVRDAADRVVRLTTGGFSYQPAGARHSLATAAEGGALLLVTSDGTWDIHFPEEPARTPTPSDSVGAARPRGLGGRR